jgi:hypothetical protein
MRKLVSIYRTLTEEARIFVSNKRFSCEVRNIKTKELTGKLIISNDSDCVETDLLPKDFVHYYKVPFERKNGKIVLYPINKQRRVIWTNNDYDEWKEALLADGEEEESLTYERYYDDCSINFDDERCNLDVEVDGYIVAFADLGLWNGRYKGAKLVGYNVKDIIVQMNDYDTIYCDQYNVRHESIHHDGTNYIIYRVAKDREQAERLANKIAYGDMDEEQFRRATKSLRPYVAKVYGW